MPALQPPKPEDHSSPLYHRKKAPPRKCCCSYEDHTSSPCKENWPDLLLGFPTAAPLQWNAAGSSQCSHEEVGQTWALVMG